MMVSHEINNICGVYNRVDVLHGVHNISPILHMGEILRTL